MLDVSDDVSDVKTAIGKICAEEKVGEGKSIKSVQFKELPRVLILQLNRFAYNSATNTTTKVKKHVNFDPTLQFDKDWLVSADMESEYTLSSVICHHGTSADGGHYNALVRFNNQDPAKCDANAGSSSWYLYDDMSHRQIAEAEVQKHSSNAYLLIYMLHKGRVDLLSPIVQKRVEEAGLG
jgi:ubiquitin C-terminal hydrolase